MSKHKVAELIYAAEEAAPVSMAEKEPPILAQCFGNRSAVLYEMQKYNASLKFYHLLDLIS